MTEFRTNSKTGNVFPVSGSRRKEIKACLLRNRLPAETREFMDFAERLGLKAEIIVKPIFQLSPRGIRWEESERQTRQRDNAIERNICSVAPIVVKGESDVLDGNHRLQVMKRLGVKRVRVLRVSGDVDALEKF